MMNRRTWIKTGGGLALGMGAAPLLARPSAVISPPSNGVVYLRANENPYGPSPLAREAIRESALQCNRYPRPYYNALREQLAELNGLTPEHILITPGSFEALCQVGRLLAAEERSFLTCTPTFDWLLRQAEHSGAKCRRLPLDEQWRFDLDALAAAARSGDVIYLCNPNNPTATTWPPERIRRFCESLLPRHTVFVDEAYIEYTSQGIRGSMSPLLEQFPNLIISRTFSKLYGLAGSRVGYLMAHPDRLKELEEQDAGLPLRVGVSALMAAAASLKDDAFVRQCREKNQSVKRRFTRQLDTWGLPYTASEVNFVWMDARPFGDQLGEALREENILVASVPTDRGEWCRITIGKEREMAQLLDALKKRI